MPLKGHEEGIRIIADRNRKNGARWRALTADQQAVFDPTTFYALAGVPNPLLSLDSENEDEDEDRNIAGDGFVPFPKVHKLKPEEDQLYCPIYKEMVDIEKVEREAGKAWSGPSSSSLQRRSKTLIKKIAHNVRRSKLFCQILRA